MNIIIIDQNKLIEWYSKFNHGEWPEDFLSPKPDVWDELYNIKRRTDPNNIAYKYLVTRPIMNMIEAVVPKKELLRYHHVHNLDRTKEQFEEWWANKENA